MECPICMEEARFAHNTSCCGYLMCAQCMTNILRDGSPSGGKCPACRQTIATVTPVRNGSSWSWEKTQAEKECISYLNTYSQAPDTRGRRRLFTQRHRDAGQRDTGQRDAGQRDDVREPPREAPMMALPDVVVPRYGRLDGTGANSARVQPRSRIHRFGTPSVGVTGHADVNSAFPEEDTRTHSHEVIEIPDEEPRHRDPHFTTPPAPSRGMLDRASLRRALATRAFSGDVSEPIEID